MASASPVGPSGRYRKGIGHGVGSSPMTESEPSASWLDEIRSAARATASGSEVEAELRKAEEDATRDYFERHRFLRRIIRPVLKDAAEELNALGWKATVLTDGERVSFEGDFLAYELRIFTSTHYWSLPFWVRKGERDIGGPATNGRPLEELTEQSVQDQVKSWAVSVIRGESAANGSQVGSQAD